MEDLDHVHPNYRGMLEQTQAPAQVEDPVSATQAQLSQMDSGARWSHEVTQHYYRGGRGDGFIPDDTDLNESQYSNPPTE